MDLHGGTSSLYGSLDGKAVHLKVSTNISDLSIYSLDVVSNGTGSLDPSSFVLSGSANAGDDILIYRIGNGDSSANFISDYFGSCYSNFDTTFITSIMTQNGDDPIALFMNNILIDSLTYSGNPILSGAFSGDPYEDSWAYRLPDRSWLFGGKDCDVDGTYLVDSSGCPYPICSDFPTTYSWDNGIIDGTAFTPNTTTTYTITATDGNGCSATDPIIVTVNSLPIVSAGADQAICEGESATLTASGATIYSWDNGVTNGAAFTPTATTIYNVSGTDTNGCFNTDSVDITVNSKYYIISPISLCTGDSALVGGSYQFSSGIFYDSLLSFFGCDSIVTVDLTLFSSIATIDTLAGNLVASGGLSYLWSTGATTSTIKPDTNGVYTVSVTDLNGCVATASFNVTYITSTYIMDNLISKVILYPNPVTYMLNISSTDNIKSLEIKDLLGRVIYFDSKINSTNTSISTSSFSNNIYTVSCIVNDKLIVKKIVISH